MNMQSFEVFKPSFCEFSDFAYLLRDFQCENCQEAHSRSVPI